MLTLFMWLLMWLGGEAQPYSAVLTVHYGVVEVRRAGTEAWFSVPRGAVMPFGEGDTIRTNETGRAMIHFDDDSGVLIIGNSLFQLNEFRQQVDNTFHVRGYVEGITLHQYTLPLSLFEMATNELTVTQASQRFAIWAENDIADAVLSAEGELSLIQDEQSYTIMTNQGYHAAYQTILDLTPPLNEPRLRSELEGCPGLIDTVNNLNLIVRNGSTVDTLPMGAIPDNTPILLLGISSSGRRYRLQFLNDFGWVDALAVETDCQDLPVFPIPYIEYSPYVVNVTEAEAAWLLPYFGAVEDDEWFYRFVREEDSAS
ncbi:MAG: hypothetical protein D6711_02075 [Chloroflexi bacterium]|nr:MAG: hypothetical protein D6711_02075 [Chloroflexota bacterium]